MFRRRGDMTEASFLMQLRVNTCVLYRDIACIVNKNVLGRENKDEEEELCYSGLHAFCGSAGHGWVQLADCC